MHEVAVLGFIAVGSRFAGNHRHLPDLGVLLLHQVFARFPLNFAAEKKLESGVERIPGQRVFRAQQLRRQSQPGAHEAPRRRGLAQHLVPVIGLELDHHAREVFRRRFVVVDIFSHHRRQPLAVGGPGPLETGDVGRDA